MLWILYMAYAVIVRGFGMNAVTPVFALSLFLALHAFAVGGIGVMTLGMMSRVALGHAGRDVYHPPRFMRWAFGAMILAALSRVVLPMWDIALYICAYFVLRGSSMQRALTTVCEG